MDSKIQGNSTDETLSIFIETQVDPIIRKDDGNHNGHGIPGQSVVDNLPHKFFIKDANLRYVSVNHHLAQDLGLSIDDIIGKTDKDLFAKDVAKRHHAVDLEILSTGTTIESEACIQRVGLTKWEKTIKAPFRDESGTICGILGMYHDITERKRAEERFRTIFEAAPYAYYLSDLKGKFVDGNKEAERITGYKKRNLSAKVF